MTRRASLRARLTAGTVAAAGLSLGAFSLALHGAFGRALWRQFDARLADEAHAVADLVEERAAGPWELEAGALAELERAHPDTCLEVWRDDGAVLARSPSLGAGDLPRGAEGAPAFVAVVLPGGRPGRVFRAALPPRWDDPGPPRPSGRRVTVAVARETGPVDETLATLRTLLWAAGAAATALAALAAGAAVRGGLSPLLRLAQRIGDVDAERLGERLPLDGLPRELEPAVRKLNEMLARLEASFARERRFSADVSHELRTPLAGLRTVLEVCASRDRSAAEYRAGIREALAVVGQMSGLAEGLLMLARLDARQVAVRREPVALRELVDLAFEPHAGRARARRLAFENRVPRDAVVTTDAEKLRMVAANLLGNAAEYTGEGGRIAVESDPARGVVLEVRDSGPALPGDALEKVFDRFYRADASRSGSDEHHGIGLSLVRELCAVLGLSVAAENRADGSVAFRVASAGAPAPDRPPSGAEPPVRRTPLDGPDRPGP